jgi:hypothetical protein
MTIVKKTKTKIKSFLRRLGLLCKKPTEQTKRIRISRTINTDGSVTEHDRLTQQPINDSNTFETELHIYNEIKKSVKKGRPSKK